MIIVSPNVLSVVGSKYIIEEVRGMYTSQLSHDPQLQTLLRYSAAYEVSWVLHHRPMASLYIDSYLKIIFYKSGGA